MVFFLFLSFMITFIFINFGNVLLYDDLNVFHVVCKALVEMCYTNKVELLGLVPLQGKDDTLSYCDCKRFTKRSKKHV